ncbi:hypothetical protein MCESLAEM7_00334 [Candidatus Pelagibacterales bacterium]
MKKITLIFFLFISSVANAQKINPENLLNNFNICQTTSSLGQRCKLVNFDYIKFFKSGKKTIDKNTIHYEVDEWDYYFEIVESTNKKTIIKFTDKAKFSKYHTVSLITLEYKSDYSKWDLVSNETVFPKSEAKYTVQTPYVMSYFFPEHMRQVDYFRKLNIQKFEFDCAVDKYRENYVEKTRYFSSFREKYFFDFDLNKITLEWAGYGLTRGGAKSKSIFKQDIPFYFEEDKQKLSTHKNIFKTVGVVRNEVHLFEILYLGEISGDGYAGYFVHQIYQLGEDAFNNFFKFYYKTGQFSEFEKWKENYEIDISKKAYRNYLLTGINSKYWAIGSCSGKEIKGKY